MRDGACEVERRVVHLSEKVEASRGFVGVARCLRPLEGRSSLREVRLGLRARRQFVA
jgi:hypothetical protein